ncbi:hypothetical protein PRIC1_003288 [Phytophthora ramorum]
MAGQRSSKVAPRRSWNSMTGLLLHSRALHSTLATLEHQEICARLISEMPRVRSPRRRLIEVQEAPRAAPSAKPLAKPLVFRKTKRELEREQQRAHEQQMLDKRRRVVEEQAQTSIQVIRARSRSARTLQWSCRRVSLYFRSRPGGSRSQPRRRLLF